jgi:predicted AlkP superfamily phosphohydrolase/phosphomutase
MLNADRQEGVVHESAKKVLVIGWDVLSHAGKKVITVGVPQTYPPKPVNGIQIGCFLSPLSKSLGFIQPF